MATVDDAEGWADRLWETFQKILDDPSHDHGLRGHIPSGGLRTAHLLGVFALTSTKNGGHWKRDLNGRLKGGRWVVHVWLYHLGGADAIPSLRTAARVCRNHRRARTFRGPDSGQRAPGSLVLFVPMYMNYIHPVRDYVVELYTSPYRSLNFV
jgi:hypothetical protein